MMVVVFRARRTTEGDGEEYRRWFLHMSELARKMPGYISHKGYVAEDGDRLTLFEWESADTLRAWATHPEHIPVKSSAERNFTLNIICKFASWCANRDSGVIPNRIRGVVRASRPLGYADHHGGGH